MKQKASRKQILKEPDEFLTLSTRMIAWGVDHKMTIVYVCCAVLAVGLIGSGIGYYFQSSEKRAAARLYQSMAKYEKLEQGSDPKSAFQQVKNDIRDVVDAYSGRAAGKQAMVILGNMSYDAMDYENAITLYMKAISHFEDQPFYKSIIASALGHAWLSRNDPDKAVPFFEMILATPDMPETDDALFQLALIHQKKGNTEKSRELFKRLSTEFKDSPFFEIASQRVTG
ncbi:MAG: tol-pal system YbgF family protein [Desulfatirhabdiaceae bacterium]